MHTTAKSGRKLRQHASMIALGLATTLALVAPARAAQPAPSQPPAWQPQPAQPPGQPFQPAGTYGAGAGMQPAPAYPQAGAQGTPGYGAGGYGAGTGVGAAPA